MKGEVKHLEIDVPGLKYRVGARPLYVVPIPAGTFLMGTTGEEYVGRPEWPQHEVLLTHDFEIGEMEITQGQWLAVMGGYPSNFQPIENAVGDNYPIYYVTWNEAVAFTSALSALTGKTFRLPTEAEWEYVCRGPEDNPFRNSLLWFTDQVLESISRCFLQEIYGRYMVYCGNSHGAPLQVGTRVPNGYGVYDATGNVAEWCLDRYDDGFYSKPQATLPDPMQDNPLFGSRSYRGGNFAKPALYARPGVRSRLDPDEFIFPIGLRVLVEVEK
jgi:formylglycine-generating enzyme required for sulfatase activity